MNKDIELLRQLQVMDTKLRDIERQHREAPEKIHQASLLAEQRAKQLDGMQGRNKKFQAEIEAQNLEMKAREEHRRKFQQQLNTVKTNKEYSAIQHEIAGIEADISRIEDKILEMMTAGDDEKERRDKAVKELEEAKAELEKIEKQVAEENKRLDAEEGEIRARREEIRSQVSKDYLDPYERLLNRRDGVALVSGANHVCQGCFIGLTPQTTASLITADKPVFCHSCGRMLYLDEET